MFSSDDESCDSLDIFDQSETEKSTADDWPGEEDDRESDGGRSTSSSCVSRLKKRVTFPTEDNLVFIREIPPRDFYSDSDTQVDSCDSDNSSSDAESDDLEDEIVEKLQICTENTSSATVSKGKYEISKSTRKTINKVAQITGANLNSKTDTNKKVSVKKRRIKSAPPSLESKSLLDKPKPKVLKPRAKSATVKSNDKPKTSVKKVKANVSKEGKKCAGTKVKCKSASKQEVNDTLNNVCGGIIEVDTRVIKPANDEQIVKTHHLSNAKDNMWSLIDCEGHSSMSCNGTGNGVYNSVNRSFEQISGKSTSNYRERPDVRTMSTTDRRLYSWLMANGNVPNPRYETPSISPLWDCSQMEGHAVKAHI
ncbi:hypothetical protein KP79_PYT09307 [Mizuhopecten yessoensis]|uniref:Uncharacterized protein n=1 Tax=Mizuhopecten yessoensis TaxID=6573 RepID=A0A210QCB9_MIZYE|nr:hypothetical protein KP79_PYT09307 [Mizuhopecten yessoensis]